MLSDAQIERYSRQIILPQFGGKGQEKILRSRVLVHTDGLLEAAALLYLAAAGVGTIGIVGSQSVTSKTFRTCVTSGTARAVFSALAENASESDQNGLDEQDGQAVQDVRIKTLTRLNPDCSIITHIGGDDEEDGLHPEQLVQHYDLVLAATATLHDACYVARKPFIWAHIVAGQAYLFVCRSDKPDWPCLRCLSSDFPVPDLLHAEPARGVEPTDAAPALFMGAQQTTEALKVIVAADQESVPKLLQCAFPAFHFTEHVVEKDPQCSLCQPGPARSL